MSEGSLNGLCRLTVRAPDKVLDLAVPADVPIADLMPVIVEHAGEDLAEHGLEHGGWVLQRLGGHPLDVEGTPESLDLREGETLVLRPRTEALPPVRYDSLLEAVSAVVQGLPHAWNPQVSRWVLRLVMASALLGCLALLVVSDGDLGDRVILAAGAALLALSGAGSAARVLDDPQGGVLLGLFGAAFLAESGLLLVGGGQAGGGSARTVGAHLLAAGAAGTVGLILATAMVSGYPVVFASCGVLSLAAVLGGALMVALDVSAHQAAAAVACAAVLLGAFIPMMSFSLSGLRLPPLPTNPGQLQEGIEPRTEADVADGGRAVDHWMTGLYGAVGVVCLAALTAMARRPGWPETVTVLVLALLLALHGRSLGTSWQRIALTLPAGIGTVLLVFELAVRHGERGQLLGTATLLLGAALTAVVSWTVPGRRLLPYWGRAGDLLQSGTALALLPLALWVLDIYQRLRSMFG
ncbi:MULTISPECIES: type VII secretion integral membrane protein EccD [unclassified Streptomyces]|uniref:type VII secretion integral membrane protein EccD n=1 Tax=unclassified Streptomyces TaxID=2593676 RepID=UPI0004C4AA65|nr:MULTISPECIES: type VII secretion integral membrane protein EccD [unclassified Streptomyces]KOV88648.1 secretion protein snm4 [Streptomyces sp. NRRL WC-3723]